VVVTRLIKWPGGDLFVNAASAGDSAKLSVRVSDAIREPFEGFDHADCVPFPGDAVRHKVTWKGNQSLAEFEGKVVRLEIFLQNVELFTMVAE
jgi:hypothetical protein